MVFDLAVTEQFRRRGKEAEIWFASQGIHRIEVRIAVSNELSTSFWNKTGFKPYLISVFKNIRKEVR
jgi:hypothetical protein